MALQCTAADLLTCDVIVNLASFDPSWPLKRTISAAETASGVLHLPGAPENWERAIREGGSLLAFWDDTIIDGVQPKPIAWCGYVPSTGDFDASSDDVTVNMATFEALFDRAYVGDVTYTTDQHRDDIIADLINSWFKPNTGITYLQLDYTPGGGPTPPPMDNPPTPNAAFVFKNSDNAKVLARMQQVFGQLGGEFTVDWAWSADGSALVPTLRFGDRIGRPAPTGPDGTPLDPVVTFRLPGSLISLTQPRSFADGDGANKIVAYSTGQGDTMPYGDPILAAPDGRPTFEYRWQPAPNATPEQLTQYGKQAAPILAPGKRPVSLVAALARMKNRLGVDWGLGDDIGYGVTSPYTNANGQKTVIRAFPRGLRGVGRCISYEITDTTLTPTLADTAVYVQDGTA